MTRYPRIAVLAGCGLVAAIVIIGVYFYVTAVLPETRERQQAALAIVKEEKRTRLEGEQNQQDFDKLSAGSCAHIADESAIECPLKQWVPQLLKNPQQWHFVIDRLKHISAVSSGIDATIPDKLRVEIQSLLQSNSRDAWVLAGELLFLAAPPEAVRQLLADYKIGIPSGCSYLKHSQADVDGDGRAELLLWEDCRFKFWDSFSDEYPADMLEIYHLDKPTARRIFASKPVSCDDFQIGAHHGDKRQQFIIRDEASFSVFEFNQGEMKEILTYNYHGAGGRQGLEFEANWRNFKNGSADELVVKEFQPGSMTYLLQDEIEGTENQPISAFAFSKDGLLHSNGPHSKEMVQEFLTQELAKKKTAATEENIAICHRLLSRK